MNILVCLKQVPKNTFVKFDENNNLIREGLPSHINPDDAKALEMALCLKDACGANITVITMGLPQSQSILQDSIDKGADQGYVITDRAFGGADTLATSYTISSAIKSIGTFDIIFCGYKTSDGNTGQVGPQISEQLHLPLVSHVQSLKLSGEKLVLERGAGKYLETVSCAMPIVITVSDMAPKLRTDKAEVPDKKITMLTCADFEVDINKTGKKGSATVVSSTFQPKAPRKGTVINEKTAKLSVDKLFYMLTENKLIG